MQIIKIPDGGPAFPDGMTMRDYFAAHAPVVPQGWFEPVMSTKQPYPAYDLQVDECINFIEIGQWEKEMRKARLVQWPYAWADAMLAERQKGGAR